jgi:hypothetical protein
MLLIEERINSLNSSALEHSGLMEEWSVVIEVIDCQDTEEDSLRAKDMPNIMSSKHVDAALVVQHSGNMHRLRNFGLILSKVVQSKSLHTSTPTWKACIPRRHKIRVGRAESFEQWLLLPVSS